MLERTRLGRRGAGWRHAGGAAVWWVAALAAACSGAWGGGGRPRAGAAKRAHPNGGQGLSAPGGGRSEAGWSSAWEASVAPTDANPTCGSRCATWSTAAGANRRRPMNCASWYEPYAFCIWDGGFLPSEAAWNYAAAGGREQREYPSSVPATSTSLGCTTAPYGCGGSSRGDGGTGCSLADLIVVGTKPGRDGRWGLSELGGGGRVGVEGGKLLQPIPRCRMRGLRHGNRRHPDPPGRRLQPRLVERARLAQRWLRPREWPHG
ncbi:MAG: SUMF1/EgtB/PvdO family nonheme iron enzyme [Polyangiaceae bacterium]|nr:SUMF1/EgtB/PvdO family nonheme iron enzyme [Polyangiaceae bacterium]